MKPTKLIASMTALLLAASLLSGCAGESASTTSDSSTSTSASASVSTSTPVSTSAPTAESGNTDDVATSGTAADPETNPTVPSDVDLTALADQIYGSISGIQFPTVITSDVSLTDSANFRYVFGIDIPASASSAVVSQPMIGSIPYTMALLKLDDTADIASIASSIESGVNPSKWVCVTADVVKTDYKGNVILLIMDKDAARADAVIDSFSKIMG